jgi:vacuolar-type H+-ATPase subunit H
MADKEKGGGSSASTSAEAMDVVLKAEQEAKAAIRDCKRKARRIVEDAQVHAGVIERRTNERITLLHLRCKQDLAKRIAVLERKAAASLKGLSRKDWRADEVTAIVDRVAAELVNRKSGKPDT